MSNFMEPEDWVGTSWFKRDPWPKDPNKVNVDLVVLMDRLRSAIGLPIHPHVCWDDDGHSDKSYHYKGEALDFHVAPGMSMMDQYLYISSFIGFGGIGFYPEWAPVPGWHVDIRKGERVLWYRMEGNYLYGITNLIRAIKNYDKMQESGHVS